MRHDTHEVRSARAHRGMVTFELAVGLLTAVLLAGVLGWGISLIALQQRCTDVAGQIARQVARGDQEAADRAAELVPEQARVETRRESELVRVQVIVAARWGVLGPVEIRGEAVWPTE